MENREHIESNMFDEINLNNRIVDSSTFDIIPTSENNDKKDEKSDEKSKIKNSRFIEMPLQINTSITKIKFKQPYLSLEDKINKNESFRNYEISLIDEKDEKKIKCYRRFSFFDALNNKLKEKYPYLIIPSLPKKNYKTKIITLEEDFYNERKKRLKHYINYIFKHENLNNSLELNKFLNDPEFDEAFFQTEPLIKLFPESERFSNTSYTGQIYDYFTGFFKTKEYTRLVSQEESHLKKLFTHYSNLNLKYKEMKKKIKVYVKNMHSNAISNCELANNFLYLKEVNFENFNNKEYFTKYNETLSDLNKINVRLACDEGEKLLEKIRNFVSLLKGLIETFERWESFISIFELVDKVNFLSKSNSKGLNVSALNKEFQRVLDMKTVFLKSFMKEINNFNSENKNVFPTILDGFKNLINLVNTNEKNKLAIIKTYFD